MHHCETKFRKNSGRGGALPPAQTTPRHLRHSCTLCPTHFLVPSGAYDSNVSVSVCLSVTCRYCQNEEMISS